MVRVGVIGGGTAGSEAAWEAAARGAEVTVFERLEHAEPPWKSWPDLILPSPVGRHDLLLSPSQNRQRSVVPICADVRSASEGHVSTSDGLGFHFDSVVAATGSSFEAVPISGYRKPGVFVLDGSRRYEELGRSRGSLDDVIIAGEGVRGLEVADRVRIGGGRVRLFASCWQRREPTPLILKIIEDAAMMQGVAILKGALERVVGAGSVEAAIAMGTVHPCDSVVIVPRRLPRALPGGAIHGPKGGLAVDASMRTSQGGMFAAGGCAELVEGPVHSTLEGEPALSGRIAGSNCMGERNRIGSIRSSEVLAFGLRWARAERESFGGTPCPTLDAVGCRFGPLSACVISFERRSGVVSGIETVEGAGVPPVGLSLAASGVTLQSLAYGGLGSSDISLVSETARLGLRDWPKSSSAITSSWRSSPSAPGSW